jgi:hypothetical protein
MFFRTQMSCSALFSALVFCFAAALSAAQTPTAQDASAPLIRTQTRLRHPPFRDKTAEGWHGNQSCTRSVLLYRGWETMARSGIGDVQL